MPGQVGRGNDRKILGIYELFPLASTARIIEPIDRQFNNLFPNVRLMWCSIPNRMNISQSGQSLLLAKSTVPTC